MERKEREERRGEKERSQQVTLNKWGCTSLRRAATTWAVYLCKIALKNTVQVNIYADVYIFPSSFIYRLRRPSHISGPSHLAGLCSIADQVM